jgi:prophage regulatory protein
MQVQPVKILRIAQVRERTGLATSSIYKLISTGGFPKPVPLTERTVGWPEHEVDDFVTSRIKQRDSTWQSLGDAATRVVEKLTPTSKRGVAARPMIGK